MRGPATMQTNAHPMILKKATDHWNNALAKFQRADPDATQGRIIWMLIRPFDWPLHPEAGMATIRQWADARMAHNPEIGVVIVNGFNWQQPVYSRLRDGSS